MHSSINNLPLSINDYWQKFIDFIKGKKAIIITTILYLTMGVFSIKYIFQIIDIINNPIKDNISINYSSSIFIVVSIIAFFISPLGDFYSKPSRRLQQFIYVVICISIFTLSYFTSLFNHIFVNLFLSIENIEYIPLELLEGNIRVLSFIVPLSLILPIFIKTLSSLKDNESRDKIRDFELDIFTPTLHPSDDTTIDIKLCEDFNTGKPCVLPEKVAFEHVWVQGATGSGKSATYVIPVIEQLLYKKSYLNYKVKSIVYDALKDNIARIKVPVTNKWFNENFDLDLIEIYDSKEFINRLGKYAIGIRNREEVLFNDIFDKEKNIVIDSLKSDDYYYDIEITILRDSLDIESKTITIKYGEENIDYEDEYITFISSLTEREKYINEFTSELKLSEDMSSLLNIEVCPKEDYEVKLLITIKGTGKIIPKGLGLTVIAPDGELIKKTVEIAKKYNIKVHKIDPFKDEIRKGNIAKFNPLKGDSPEKIGDIVASILVSMEIGNSSKTNPYFTNASVRAIRNLVILLKVTYPILHGKDPTLEDVLSCLNDFNSVEKYVDELENNPNLRKRWSSVIDYFKASFLDAPKDHNNQQVKNSHIGSQKRKTLESLTGITNQLDNLLSRQEIRDILCDSNESIDLKKVLEKGECIAISTRQGELGPRLGRAFALFFILSLQNEVLSRYSENENPEVPHYLIIDEFPMYCNENTETFFTFARKYRCSVTMAIQNIGQLKKISDEFAETLFTNTTTKLLMSKSNLEDSKYWSAYFGNTEKLDLSTGVSTNTMAADNPSYTETIRGGVKLKRNITEDDIRELKFLNVYYQYTDHKGIKRIGKGITDFAKINEEPFMKEVFDFESYAISREDYNRIQKKKEAIERQKKIDEINKNILNIEKNNNESDNNTNNNYTSVNTNAFYEVVEDDNTPDENTDEPTNDNTDNNVNSKDYNEINNEIDDNVNNTIEKPYEIPDNTNIETTNTSIDNSIYYEVNDNNDSNIDNKTNDTIDKDNADSNNLFYEPVITDNTEHPTEIYTISDIYEVDNN